MSSRSSRDTADRMSASRAASPVVVTSDSSELGYSSCVTSWDSLHDRAHDGTLNQRRYPPKKVHTQGNSE